jgi:phage terminase small subunit
MLTQKQEAFALAYLHTGNASEAYRQAYNAQNMKSETIHVKASELLKNGKVRGRIEDVQKMALEHAGLTLGEHLTRLQQLSEKAEQEAKYSEAIKAEELRGKASGFYTEKVEHSGAIGVNMAVDRSVAEAIAREFVRDPD